MLGLGNGLILLFNGLYTLLKLVVSPVAIAVIASALSLAWLAWMEIEELNRQGVAYGSRYSIVAGALVTHERMGGIELVPLKRSVGVRQRVVDDHPAFTWHVWILPSPDHKQFAINIFDTVQTIIIHSQT